VELDARQARHLRDVLRISAGDAVELFDDAGKTAMATVLSTAGVVVLNVDMVVQTRACGVELTIAAAAPKGPRADWMVEKLSELGVSCYVPLETDRGVVHPEEGKLQRWRRIAGESAKQCGRTRVMRIGTPMTVQVICAAAEWQIAMRWCMATSQRALPMTEALRSLGTNATVLATVGPEGGWTEAETGMMHDSHFQMVGLTRTILRIETAALALAAVVMVEGEKS
jgi:16S rRNA (uracil1498-N3)-methyltransferase